MKISPFVQYIKVLVDDTLCTDCEECLIFKRVNYDHLTLKRGGFVRAYGDCDLCLRKAEMIIQIQPLKEELVEELIEEEENEERNIHNSVFFVKGVNRKEKKRE